MTTRCYSDLIQLPTFEERFNYLRLDGTVCAETFGVNRYLNQVFYRSSEWRKLRNEIIVRDNGCDLGIEGHEIQYRGGLLIHHINPITIDDINNHSYILVDPENLITVTHRTHNAIHYGDESCITHDPIERRPYDTCPWKR